MKTWQKELQNQLLNNKIDFNTVVKFKEPYIPQKLYRFDNFEKDESTWKSTIYEGKLSYSSPFEFTDPFDCHLRHENQQIFKSTSVISNFIYLIEKSFGKISNQDKRLLMNSENAKKTFMELLKKYGLSETSFYAHFDKIYDRSMELYRRNYKVICFSENLYSMLMWRNYTKNHKGYCIEYNFSDNKNFKDYLFPVLYTKEHYNLNDYLNYENVELDLLGGITKPYEWKYEKEWRWLSQNTPETEISIADANADPQMIKSIYLGAKADDENVNQVLNYYQYKPVHIYKMHVNPNNYTLARERLK